MKASALMLLERLLRGKYSNSLLEVKTKMEKSIFDNVSKSLKRVPAIDV
jgi:hypothetical protein